MEKEPLISIITITFNAEHVIRPTLYSIRNQSFSDFEHILIDGASSDDTVSIARKEGIDGIRILSEPDNGLYDAMNKSIAMARGKYILFLNAGDSFASVDTLSLYAEQAKKDKDIIYGDTMLVDIDGNFIAPRHLSAPERLTPDSFSKGMLICHQAFMVKRDLAPLYDTSYRFSADYDWCIRCIRNSSPDKCINLHQTTIRYLTNGLTDNNMKQSLRERFEIMRRYYGLIPTIANHLSFIPRFIIRKFKT